MLPPQPSLLTSLYLLLARLNTRLSSFRAGAAGVAPAVAPETSASPTLLAPGSTSTLHCDRPRCRASDFMSYAAPNHPPPNAGSRHHRPSSSYAPTSTPSPGQPLMRRGNILVYPNGWQGCPKCELTHANPTQPGSTDGVLADCCSYASQVKIQASSMEIRLNHAELAGSRTANDLILSSYHLPTCKVPRSCRNLCH